MNWRETEEIISRRGRTHSKVVAVSLAIASFSLGVVLPSHAEEKINVKVDYVAKLNELAKAGRPEELNAAPFYKKAFELVVEQPEQLKELDYKTWPPDLPAEQQEALQKWVQQNGKALAQLRMGVAKPFYWTKYQGSSVMRVEFPSLSKARILAHAMSARAKLNAAKGNFKDAFADLVMCYRFGTHFAGPKTLREQLVGIAIRAIALREAFRVLREENPPANLLRDFQQQLQTLSSKEQPIIDFTYDRFMAYDNIQRVFTDDGKGGGHFPKSEVEAMMRMATASGNLSPKELEELRRKLEKLERRKTAKLADRIYEYFSRIARKTPWQWRNEDIQKVVEEMTNENPFLRIWMPAAGRVVEMSFRAKLGTDALVTTLALLRHKADKGHFPTTLVKLVLTGYIRKLPMDPYSDKPLFYRREKDNFTLYSLGADFDDDGGVPSKWGEGEKGGDQVFWPVQPIQEPKGMKNQK